MELILISLIVLIVFLGYFTIIFGLNRFGVFKKYNIKLFGPILMWRTKRGRKFLDRLSQRRTFWRWYGNLAIIICSLAMVFMFVILILGGIAAVTIPTEPMPLENILVLPGINPMIPLWYGIFALAIAIVLHEFAHGILARRIKLKIKSLGMLLFIVPIGAFVEPDEKKLEKINRRDRMRIFSGGPTTNIIFALIFAGLFSWSFMGSLAPVEDGVVVLNVSEDFPAETAGIKPGMLLTEIEGTAVNGSTIEPTRIKTRAAFGAFMDDRKMNDTINISGYYKGERVQFNNITLSDQYNYTLVEGDRGSGFLGVGVRGASEFIESLAHPITSAGDDVQKRRFNILQYVFILPMDFDMKILPFHSPLTDVYEVQGPLAALPTPVFWIMANAFYYLFWINLLLGIFNALPGVPLDGGYVFKDTMDGMMVRLKPKMTEEKRKTVINTLSLSLAFLILLFLMMTIIGPRLLW